MSPQIRAAVFDIDGTLALMDDGAFTALPGAAEALAACRAARIPAVAYTNGTFFPPARYYPLLAEAGLLLDPGHILTPAAVAAHHLAQRGLARVMVLGGEGTRVPLREAGLEIVDPAPGAPRVEAVLLGHTRDFGAAELEAAVRAVWDGAAAFAGSVAPFFAGRNGRLLGISGALAAALEHATGTRVTVLGKPESAGLEMVAALTGAVPAEMAVIGDDPSLEIRMGRRAGALTIGVTTGLCDRAAFAAAPEDSRPHMVLSDLHDLAHQPWLRQPA